MIILEGPDGAGKTTLLEDLSKRFEIPKGPRASDSEKGPVRDLCGWVDNDLMNWGQRGLRIYDRYPLISEPIYGPLLRGSVPYRMTTSWMRSRLNTLRGMSLVIWCLPDVHTVIRNVEDSGNAQMDGVVSQITSIWNAYAVASNSWTGPGMTYDYTTDNPAPQHTQLLNVIRRHMNSWRHFS